MATLKDGNETPPRPPTPVAGDHYRPPHSLPHLVSTGENWQTLSARYKIGAQDLIRQNFLSTEAEHVNWYLHHRVKCDTTTPDRYNWVFSSSARHNGGPHAGTIYITPQWFAIVDAAQILAARWFEDFVAHAMLPTRQFGPTRLLDFHHDDFRWDTTGDAMKFRTSLGWQGATDALAEAWADAVAACFRDLGRTVALAVAFSPAMAPPPTAGPVVPVGLLLPPFPVFEAGAGRGLFAHHQPLIAQRVGLLHDGPAREALARFNQWWDLQVPRLCKRVKVRQILLTGNYSHATDLFQGTAFGARGCLGLKPA